MTNKDLCSKSLQTSISTTFKRKREEAQASNEYFSRENMKACPHCGKGPIFRSDGCNQMVYDKNAPDKRHESGLVMYPDLDANDAG